MYPDICNVTLSHQFVTQQYRQHLAYLLSNSDRLARQAANMASKDKASELPKYGQSNPNVACLSYKNGD